MEPTTQPSFIPHDAGTPARPRPAGSGFGDIILMFAILAFAVSAALAVGVFLYVQYLTSVSNADHTKLLEAQKRFEPALVTELQRLDNRINSASAILSTHLAPSVFFVILDAITAKTVSYSSFALSVADDIKLEMDGVARSINSVAFQADLLSKDGAYQNPIFSNLTRDKEGVHFHLSTEINQDALDFESLTNAAAGSLVPQTPSLAPAASGASTTPFGTAPAQ